MFSRRRFVALATFAVPAIVHGAPSRLATLSTSFQQLERINGGRLGVAAVDSGTGEHADYRGNERFPLCSTFKFLLAAAVLLRVDRHEEVPDRAIGIPKTLLGHSPLTQPHAGRSMTVAALCHAVVTQSDNTAANLLLETLGGPKGITTFSRHLGDDVTHLDRTEPTLNEALEGDPRDTTSPIAMAGNLNTVLLGSALSLASRQQLTQWMIDCETGLDRLRATLPADWRAADKTGTNGTHTSNDIAVFWPSAGGALIVAAYITQCRGPETKRAALLAEIGRLIRR